MGDLHVTDVSSCVDVASYTYKQEFSKLYTQEFSKAMDRNFRKLFNTEQAVWVTKGLG